jgi:hypothetical protein
VYIKVIKQLVYIQVIKPLVYTKQSSSWRSSRSSSHLCAQINQAAGVHQRLQVACVHKAIKQLVHQGHQQLVCTNQSSSWCTSRPSSSLCTQSNQAAGAHQGHQAAGVHPGHQAFSVHKAIKQLMYIKVNSSR